jgi:hypothetical protein
METRSKCSKNKLVADGPRSPFLTPVGNTKRRRVSSGENKKTKKARVAPSTSISPLVTEAGSLAAPALSNTPNSSCTRRLDVFPFPSSPNADDVCTVPMGDIKLSTSSVNRVRTEAEARSCFAQSGLPCTCVGYNCLKPAAALSSTVNSSCTRRLDVFPFPSSPNADDVCTVPMSDMKLSTSSVNRVRTEAEARSCFAQSGLPCTCVGYNCLKPDQFPFPSLPNDDDLLLPYPPCTRLKLLTWRCFLCLGLLCTCFG